MPRRNQSRPSSPGASHSAAAAGSKAETNKARSAASAALGATAALIAGATSDANRKPPSAAASSAAAPATREKQQQQHRQHQIGASAPAVPTPAPEEKNELDLRELQLEFARRAATVAENVAASSSPTKKRKQKNGASTSLLSAEARLRDPIGAYGVVHRANPPPLEPIDSDSEAETYEQWQESEHYLYPWRSSLNAASKDEVDFGVVQQAVDIFNQDPLTAHAGAQANNGDELSKKMYAHREELFCSDLMTYLNQFWTYIMHLGIPTIMQQILKLDPIDGKTYRRAFVQQKDTTFHKCLANQRVTIRGTGHVISKWWEDSPLRKNKNGIVFQPGPPGKIPETEGHNLWTGTRITPEMARAAARANPQEYKQQTARWLYHIKNIICSGHEEASEYFLNWMARILQHPEEKQRVAIAIRGEEGAGKGLVCMMLRSIIGLDSFSHIGSVSDLLTKFNAPFMEKCLVAFVDEVNVAKAGSSRRVAQADKLKGLISEDTHRVEPKYLPSLQLPSFTNYIFTSNHPHMLHLPPGVTRRFLILDSADTYAGPETNAEDCPVRRYFEPLRAVKPEYIARYLFTRNTKKFRSNQVPITKDLMVQKLWSLAAGSVENWWIRCMQDEHIPGLTSLQGQGCYFNQQSEPQWKGGEVPAWQVIRERPFVYNAYRSNHPGGATRAVPETQFWPIIRKIAPVKLERKNVTLPGQQKACTVVFGPLEECKRVFALKVLGMRSADNFDAWLHSMEPAAQQDNGAVQGEQKQEKQKEGGQQQQEEAMMISQEEEAALMAAEAAMAEQEEEEEEEGQDEADEEIEFEEEEEEEEEEQEEQEAGDLLTDEDAMMIDDQQGQVAEAEEEIEEGEEEAEDEQN
jgi:hypothetical protein